MNRTWRGRVVPGLTAAVCLALVSAATVWSAKPLYGPLQAEFHWPAASLAATGFLSLAITAATIWRLRDLRQCVGERHAAIAGCLLSGLLLLIGLPNQTHLWQTVLLVLALGLTRAAVLAAAWDEFRRGLSPGLAVAVAGLSALAGLLIVTPWIAEVIYRNSWREGAAVCGGLLLIIALPLAYVLLPGSGTKHQIPAPP